MTEQPAVILLQSVHFHLVLDAEDYQALCREWLRRRELGERVNIRLLIIEAIRKQLPKAAV